MKTLNNIKPLIVILAITCCAWSVRAAAISFRPAATVAWDSDVLTEGTLVSAYDQSNVGDTVNGVTFTAGSSTTTLGSYFSMSGWGGGPYDGFDVGNTPYAWLTGNYKNVLKGSCYDGLVTVTLNNLIVGHQYAVQIWAEDPRWFGGNRNVTVTSSGGNSVNLDYNSFEDWGGLGQYTVGTFTADATTQTFTLNGNVSTQMNAIQLRDITGNSPIIFGSATTLSDDTDVSTAGALVYAYDLSGVTTTVNGVTFTGESSTTALGGDVTLSEFNGNYGSYGDNISNLSADYKTMVGGGDYANGANAVTITLHNLTAGNQYAIQIWVNDSRGCCGGGRHITVTSIAVGGNSVTLNYNNTGNDGGIGQYVIGTFTAGATTQTLRVTGNASTQINAIQLRDVTTPPTAPYNIQVSPGAQTQYMGGQAFFFATANGTAPLSYRWNANGSPIIGATNSILRRSSLTTGDAGSYTCTVTNAGGSITSGVVTLSVVPLPSGMAGKVLSDLPLAYYRLSETVSPTPDVAVNSGSLGAAGNGMYFPGSIHQVPGSIVGDSDTAAGYTAIDQSSCDGGVPTVVPFDAALNPNTSFTVEAWLKPAIDGLGNAQMPMRSRFDDGSGNRNGWDFWQRGSGVGWNWRLFNGNGSGKVFDITGGTYTVGQWCHLVAVYDASVPSATLYLNGAQVVQSTSPNGSYSPNPSAPLAIGGYENGTENPFIGSIDEFALYNTALSADQVLADYQNGTNAARTVAYSSLIISTNDAMEYLRLDEPAHNTAANLGSLGAVANGTYVNTTNGMAGPRPPANVGFELTNVAAAFNGINSYVELGNPAVLNFSSGNALTMEAWIQPAASQNGEAYIIAHGGNDAFSGEVVLRIENGSYTVGAWPSAGMASYPVPSGDLGGTNWVHLAGTYDGSRWNLYRNGVLVASASGTGPTVVDNANWAIGARGRWKNGPGFPASGEDRQFSGSIDEAAIYNYALSISQIQAHYTVGTSNPLAITTAGAAIIVTWTVGTLQQADNVAGPYSDLSGATSPYNPPAGATQKFYRIKF